MQEIQMERDNPVSGSIQNGVSKRVSYDEHEKDHPTKYMHGTAYPREITHNPTITTRNHAIGVGQHTTKTPVRYSSLIE